MMTIKHISISGEERLFEAKSVRLSSNETPETVWFTTPDGKQEPLTGGTVYVMNDNGKTVSRFDIGASPEPSITLGNSGATWNATRQNPLTSLT